MLHTLTHRDETRDSDWRHTFAVASGYRLGRFSRLSVSATGSVVMHMQSCLVWLKESERHSVQSTNGHACKNWCTVINNFLLYFCTCTCMGVRVHITARLPSAPLCLPFVRHRVEEAGHGEDLGQAASLDPSRWWTRPRAICARSGE